MDKKELEKEVRKMIKKDSYNKKALEISKEIIRNLYFEVETYHYYTYFELLEVLEEKMKIIMDYGILYNVIEALEKEGGLLDTKKVVYYIEN